MMMMMMITFWRLQNYRSPLRKKIRIWSDVWEEPFQTPVLNGDS